MPGRLMQQLLLSSRAEIRPVLQETAIAPRQNIWPMFYTRCTDILISQIKTIEERDERRSFIRLWKTWLNNTNILLAVIFCVSCIQALDGMRSMRASENDPTRWHSHPPDYFRPARLSYSYL